MLFRQEHFLSSYLNNFFRRENIKILYDGDYNLENFTSFTLCTLFLKIRAMLDSNSREIRCYPLINLRNKVSIVDTVAASRGSDVSKKSGVSESIPKSYFL